PESEGTQTGAMVEMHRQEYSRIFKGRVHGGYEKITDLLGRPNRVLPGVKFSFPIMKLDHRGRPKPVKGLSWGGARRGKAFSLQRQEGGLGLRAGSESADRDVVDAVTDPPNPMAQDNADCRAADQECIQSTPVNTPLPAPTPTATTGMPED
ncbi:unnamed protein product, partial [Closterium sp. Naga37s-1]